MILSTQQHELIHLRLLMLFCFLLPLHPWSASLCIVFTVLHWLSTGVIIRNFKSLLNPIPILFISFYFLHLIGMIYTSNQLEGWQKLETKLSLLIFPLILFTFPIKDKSSFFSILKSFVLGCLVASVYCFVSGVWKTDLTGKNWLIYSWLGSFLEFHPTYFALYISLCLFIVLHFLVKNFSKKSTLAKIGNIALLTWFYIFVLLLASRIVILATGFLLVLAILKWKYSQKKFLQGIGLSFIAILFFGASLKIVPGVNNRTNKTLEMMKNQLQENGTTDVRINIWSSSLQLIKDHLPFGTGIGDMQDELLKIYKKRNLEKESQKNFNPHNQYLHTTAALGLFGGILILCYLLYPFFKAYKHGNNIYLYFLGLIMISFLTESILQRQHGTLFFGFFHTLFVMRTLPNFSKT